MRYLLILLLCDVISCRELELHVGKAHFNEEQVSITLIGSKDGTDVRKFDFTFGGQVFSGIIEQYYQDSTGDVDWVTGMRGSDISNIRLNNVKYLDKDGEAWNEIDVPETIGMAVKWYDISRKNGIISYIRMTLYYDKVKAGNEISKVFETLSLRYSE